MLLVDCAGLMGNYCLKVNDITIFCNGGRRVHQMIHLNHVNVTEEVPKTLVCVAHCTVITILVAKKHSFVTTIALTHPCRTVPFITPPARLTTTNLPNRWPVRSIILPILFFRQAYGARENFVKCLIDPLRHSRPSSQSCNKD